MRSGFASVTVCGLVSVSTLGQSAVLTMSHNDPDGIVTPGQVVQFEVVIASTGTAQFWEVRGDVIASPNAGVVANPRFGTFPVPANPGAIVHFGSPLGGSLLGVHVLSGDAGITIGWPTAPPWYYNPLRFLQFEWTAPSTPGVVDFEWRVSSLLPEPLYLVPPGPYWPPTPVPTTYVGTSLTVIPGPGGMIILGTGLVAGAGRRRRVTAAR